jgi:hypothetical protein
MDDIKLIAHEPVLGKYPQKDGGGTITFHYSADQHLKATAIVMAQDQEQHGVELTVRQVDDE